MGGMGGMGGMNVIPINLKQDEIEKSFSDEGVILESLIMLYYSNGDYMSI